MNSRLDWFSEIEIRLAQEQDLPDLEWNGEYTHYRRLFRQIFNSMNVNEAHIWIACHNRFGLVGQMFLQLLSNRLELADGRTRGYIYGFRVKPSFRRRGLGSLMLEHVEDELRNLMYSWATLNVAKDNLNALKFYRQHGYRIVANEPGKWSYIDDQGELCQVHEPAFRMEKLL